MPLDSGFVILRWCELESDWQSVFVATAIVAATAVLGLQIPW